LLLEEFADLLKAQGVSSLLKRLKGLIAEDFLEIYPAVLHVGELLEHFLDV